MSSSTLPPEAAWRPERPIVVSLPARREPAPGATAFEDPALPRVAAKLREALVALELDLTDPNLKGTEWRMARAYRQLFAGLRPEAEPVLRTFPNTQGYTEPVSVMHIPFHSLCAHHLLPFFGAAHVAYVPKGRVVGLSKLARVVDFFARRPQVQEAMTEQIARFLDDRLGPIGVMVVLEARHFCMEMRGVAKSGLTTTTSAARGAFEDAARRQEFLALCQRSSHACGARS